MVCADKCKERLNSILKYMASCKQSSIKDCDDIQGQYECFIQEAKVNDMNFNPNNDRLDKFYYENMKNNNKYSKVWAVISLLLLLSHGQATVERGFSFNKEVSEVNLSEHNLIAQRVITDHISYVGGLQRVIVMKELLQSAQHARHAYLDKRKQTKLRNIRQKRGKWWWMKLKN